MAIPKLPSFNAVAHILGGVACQGGLQIMDNARPVHGNHGDDIFFHQVDQNRGHAGLNHMAAHGKADLALIFNRFTDGADDVF